MDKSDKIIKALTSMTPGELKRLNDSFKKSCEYPGCKHKVDHSYDDFCFSHERAIAEAHDEYDHERQLELYGDTHPGDFE